MEAILKEVKAKVIEHATDGKITCAAAQGIAKSLGIEYITVGRAANEAGIKVIDCQLGCFGVSKER